MITMQQFFFPKSLDNHHYSCNPSLLCSVMGIRIIILNLTVQCEKLYKTKKYNMLCRLVLEMEGKESEEAVPKAVVCSCKHGRPIL